MSSIHARLLYLFLSLCMPAMTWALEPATPLSVNIVVPNALKGAKNFVAATKDPATVGSISTIGVFSTVLVLCEARQLLDEVDGLLALAEPLFDRNPASPTYGNIRARLGDTSITDVNTIDWCMQYVGPLWLRHRDAMPTAARERLRGILTIAVEGLKVHKLNPGYTNMALMNAACLIVIGDSFNRVDVSDEGYARLDSFYAHTQSLGIGEYCATGYYNQDLDQLQTIVAFAKRERGRQQAIALLRYWWTDIALHWFPAAQKLAGPRSRDYSPLNGVGVLDYSLVMAGWLPPSPISNILSAYITWYPPNELWTLANSTAPRMVYSRYGANRNNNRACFMNPDVALGVAGTGYGWGMDVLLSVDLPGTRGRPRMLFVPDGNRDPYGTKHLWPLWSATQHQGDVLSLALYRDRDRDLWLWPSNNATTIQSHIVFPRDLSVWVGNQSVTLNGTTPVDMTLAQGQALVLRQGTAAVGIRLAWARDTSGNPAAAHLIDDGNTRGAARLTVNHQWTPGTKANDAGAAFWVRVGSDLTTDAAFDTWRTAFVAASIAVTVNTTGITMNAVASDGTALEVKADAPFTVTPTVKPAWPSDLMASNGDDMGSQLLANATLAGLSPTSGTTTGGTKVTITGTNLTGTSAVTFGGIAATSVEVIDATSVTCIAPTQQAGPVDVTLTTPGSPVTSVASFTYMAPPSSAAVNSDGGGSGGSSGSSGSCGFGSGIAVLALWLMSYLRGISMMTVHSFTKRHQDR